MNNVGAKRARVNKDKQPKKPSDNVGLVSNGRLIIGSNSESGAALVNNSFGTLPLSAQEKQQEEFLIKKLEEDNQKEKEARVAAENKVSALTEKLNVFCSKKCGWEDAAKRLKERATGLFKKIQVMKENDKSEAVQADLQNEATNMLLQADTLLQQLENKKSLNPRVLVILWTRFIQGKRFEPNNRDSDSGIDWEEHYMTYPEQSRSVGVSNRKIKC